MAKKAEKVSLNIGVSNMYRDFAHVEKLIKQGHKIDYCLEYDLYIGDRELKHLDLAVKGAIAAKKAKLKQSNEGDSHV